MIDAAVDDDEYETYPTLAVPPLYVLRLAEHCPACGDAQHVYTLGCDAFRHADDSRPVAVFHFLRYIESVPASILNMLKPKCPGYFLDKAEDFPRPYLMNHCRCGAKLDDDFLHGEVGAAFFPDVPEGYGHIRLFTLPVDEPMPVVSSYAIGGDEYLEFEKAKPW